MTSPIRIIFVTPQRGTFEQFRDRLDGLIRESAPLKMTFSYDEEGHQEICHFVFKWMDAEGRSADFHVTTILMGDRFHPFLGLVTARDHKIYYVSDTGVSGLLSELIMMKALLHRDPCQPMANILGCLYFPKDPVQINQSFLKEISGAIGTPIYWESFDHMGVLGRFIFQKLMQEPSNQT